MANAIRQLESGLVVGQAVGVLAGGSDVHVEAAGGLADRQHLRPQGVHGRVALASVRRPTSGVPGSGVAGADRAGVGSVGWRRQRRCPRTTA